MVAEVSLMKLPSDEGLIDGKSTLVQVMAWCCQATSHYQSQCWPRSMSLNGVTRPQWVNIVIYASFCETSKLSKRQGRDLKHGNLNKKAILQITLSNWKKSFIFQLKSHCNVFIGVQLTISQHWFSSHMMRSSNENIFRITGPLCREFTGHRWFPLTKASNTELWCFLWSALTKWFSKQSRGWWFKTPSCSLWRHCNETGAEQTSHYIN